MRDSGSVLPNWSRRGEGAGERREANKLSSACRVLTGLLVLGLMVLAACNSQLEDSADPSQATPASGVSEEPMATPSPPEPTIAGVLCLDTSTSYDRGLLSRAQTALADRIDALLQPGCAGATLYVRAVKENSYSWDAELMAAIMVPAVPPEPTPPAARPEPTPPDFENVFESWSEKKAAQEKYEADHADWENAVRQDGQSFQNETIEYQSSLESAKANLRQQTDELRNLAPPLAYGSDIWGCLTRGGELLHDKPGEKYIIIASDLEVYGRQEKTTELSLDGVIVRVVYLRCTHAQDCEQTKSFWTQVFDDGGATDVKFYGPEEPIADIWSR
jgi:hypothetical protein